MNAENRLSTGNHTTPIKNRLHLKVIKKGRKRENDESSKGRQTNGVSKGPE